MHIFEIDRRGESVRIWEEIEQRTKDLQAAQAPSQLEPTPKSTNPANNLGQHSKTHKACSEKKKPRIPLHHEEDALSEHHYEDDLSVQVDESDDIYRLQELRGPRAAPAEGHYTSVENLLERQREQYFQATNPPKLSSRISDNGKRPSRHTSMRLSDVLNDENEPKEVAQETEPLLVTYPEGNLTEEGKRQVRAFLPSIFDT